MLNNYDVQVVIYVHLDVTVGSILISLPVGIGIDFGMTRSAQMPLSCKSGRVTGRCRGKYHPGNGTKW